MNAEYDKKDHSWSLSQSTYNLHLTVFVTLIIVFALFYLHYILIEKIEKYCPRVQAQVKYGRTSISRTSVWRGPRHYMYAI